MAKPNGATDLTFEGEGQQTAARPTQSTPEEQRAAAAKQLGELIASAVSQAMAPIAERLDRLEAPGSHASTSSPEADISPQDFYRDPLAVIEKVASRIAERTLEERGGLAANLAIRTAHERAIDKIRTMDPVGWSALEADYQREIQNIPPERLAQVSESGETGAEQFYYYMRGRPQYEAKIQAAREKERETREATERENRRTTRAPYVEIGGSRVTGGGAISPKGLSKEMLEVADKMGITPDQYAQSLRSLETGEPLFSKKAPASSPPSQSPQKSTPTT
jgi:hypothetical protein